MPIELFKPQHRMRGVETLKMVNEEDRNSSGGLRIQPWVWAIIVSLAIQILGAAYVTGRVTAQLDGVSYRVGRIEAQMDRYFGGVKP